MLFNLAWIWKKIISSFDKKYYLARFIRHIYACQKIAKIETN